jgi:hypothetical protein
MLSLWNRFGFAVIPNFTRNCPRSKERRAYTHPNIHLQVFFNKYTILIVTRLICRTISKSITYFQLCIPRMANLWARRDVSRHVSARPYDLRSALSGGPDTRRPKQRRSTERLCSLSAALRPIRSLIHKLRHAQPLISSSAHAGRGRMGTCGAHLILHYFWPIF